MANQECVCGHVWGDPDPTNCLVHRADGHFTVARTLYYRYHQLWVPWSKVYLVHITPLLPLGHIRNAYVAHIPALLWNQNCVYGLVSDAVVPTNERFPVADYDFRAVQTLYCMNRPYWVRGSKGYVVHKAHLPPAVELKGAIWPSLGCLRSHKRGRSCGRLRFYGSLDPKLYVPAILGLWVYRLFGTAHITLAVEWKITFIAKFGVPSSPQSRASLLWNEKSRSLPSLGCPCSHNRGCNCGRLWYLVHIAHI